MKKIFLFLLALFFSVDAYAQQKNVYMIDANGNAVILYPPTNPGGTGITSFTFPTTSGTVLTSAPPGTSTAQTINSPLSLGSYSRWYSPNGLLYTEISALNTQAANQTYYWPIDNPTNGQVLTWNTGGQLSWENAGSGGSTFDPGITIGDDAGGTAGTIIVEDANNGTSNQATVTGAASYGGARTYTLDDVGADASFVMTEGNQTIDGMKTFSGHALLQSNATLGSATGSPGELILYDAGIDNTVTVASADQTGNYFYSIPQTGGSADFVMTEGNQTINGTKTFSNLQSNNVTITGGTISGATLNSSTFGNDATPTPAALVLHDNTSGNGFTQTIRTADPLTVGSATITIPNTADVDADFVLTEGAQTINGAKTFTNVPSISRTNADIAINPGAANKITTNGSFEAAVDITAGDDLNATDDITAGDDIIATGDVTAASFSGNGANITNINAANITGTATSAMSFGSQNGIRLYDATNTHYTELVGADDMNPNSNVTYEMPSAIGSVSQVLSIASVAWNTATLQWATASGSGGSSLTLGDDTGPTAGTIVMHDANDDNSDGATTEHTGTIQMTDLTADRTYTFPDASGTVLLSGVGGASSTLADLYLSGTATSGGVTLDVNGATANRATSISVGSTTVNSLAIDKGGNIRLTGTPGGKFTINGIANGANGRRLHLYNATGQDMVLADNSSSGAAGEKIATMAGGDITLRGASAVDLIFDATLNQWALENSIAVNGVTGVPGSSFMAYHPADSALPTTTHNVVHGWSFYNSNPSAVYEVSGVIFMTGTQSGTDLQMSLTYPGTDNRAALTSLGYKEGSASSIILGANVVRAKTTAVANDLNVGNASGMVLVQGTIFPDATGWITFNLWNAGTGTLTLNKGSFMKITRVF